MCQDCGQPMGLQQQVDFLKRYLSDQKARLNNSRKNPELAAEVQKAESLLAQIQKQTCECGENQ
jgi:hypothetical protein